MGADSSSHLGPKELSLTEKYGASSLEAVDTAKRLLRGAVIGAGFTNELLIALARLDNPDLLIKDIQSELDRDNPPVSTFIGAWWRSEGPAQVAKMRENLAAEKTRDLLNAAVRSKV